MTDNMKKVIAEIIKAIVTVVAVILGVKIF